MNCRVTGAGMVYLGRAWGAYSRVVYIHTYIDDIILPDAWNDWGIPSRQKYINALTILSPCFINLIY